MASAFNAQSDPGVVFKSFSASQGAEFEKAFPLSRDLEQEDVQDMMNQLQNSSYNKSIVPVRPWRSYRTARIPASFQNLAP